MSGKANLKIWGINKNGGGTIMIGKVSGGDFEHAKQLALKVVKFLIEKMISGSIKKEDIEKFKKSKKDDANENAVNNLMQCGVCEKKFDNVHGLKIQVAKMHRNVNIKGDWDVREEKEHIVSEHEMEITDNETEEEEEVLKDNQLKQLEDNSYIR